MLVEPNFDEIADEVTPGDYRVRVSGAEAGEWSTGTKYINWTLETIGDDDPKNNGRKIFYKTPTVGKGAFMLQKFYRAVTGEALDGNFDTEQLMGQELLVTVDDGFNRNTGEKTGYIEVKSVRPAS